ncbi:hypothetical protein GCM10025787_28730 [Saccharopolyspora rosea]|uniref:Uncharacterized protein n=1 Tax=Saccharopolyspora rosea TaxID=524884 RepID=A0ABW3FN39_9PSEU
MVESGPPRPLRWAISLWWVVALLLAALTALAWTVGTGAPPRPGAPPADAARLLLVHTALAAVLVAAYLVLGAMLFRRRPWVRIVLSVFALVHLLMLLGTGAVLGAQAVLVVLGGTAAVLMWRRPSTEWLTGEHD